MSQTPPNPYSDLPPSLGLAQDMEPRTIAWDDIKDKSMLALIRISPGYGKTTGIPLNQLDPSF